MIRVLIADDDGLVRAGISMIIESTEDISVIGEATNGTEAVDMALRLRPDIVLMDIQMPGLNGIEATRRILEHPQNDIKVVVVTTFELDKYVFEAIRAGASGYLLKRSGPDELLDGVRIFARAASQAIARGRIDRLF